MKLRKGRHTIEKLVILSLLYVGELTVTGCGNNPTSPPAESTQPRYTPVYKVTFPTVDGLMIMASWSIPPNVQGRVPVVILIHHFQNNNHLYDDRTQWFGIFDEFLSQGYGVLAIDLRGHGESLFGISPRNMTTQDLESMIFDVAAAVSWLKHRSDIDPSRIAVVGGNIGANIAYVSSGVFREVRTAIALSPLITNPPTLIGENIPRFAPHSILFMASSSDDRAIDAVNRLSQSTTAPKRVEVLEDSTSDTSIDDWGMGLINFHADARKIVFDWLRDTL